MKLGVNKMVTMAMLIALSVVLTWLVHFPFLPWAPSYLEYDPADIPILIGGFIFGPLAGFIIAVIAALIQMLTVSAASGWVGFVMHVIATGTLVIVASSIYKRFRTLKGAICGLIAGCIAMTLVMIPANLFFTVKFFNTPYEVVKGMILPILIPFNLIKSFANATIVLVVYKSVGRVLQGIAKTPIKTN